MNNVQSLDSIDPENFGGYIDEDGQEYHTATEDGNYIDHNGEIIDEGGQQQNPPQHHTTNAGEQDNSFLEEFLKGKGIDFNNISVLEEDGTQSFITFNDLSREEQFSLFQEQQSVQSDLSEDEQALVNLLRENQLSSEDYINYMKNTAVEEYLASQQEVFEIDQLSDEEVYVVNLQTQIEGLTEQEALDALEQAQQNPDLFKRQVEAIRKTYAAHEEARIEEEARAREEMDREEMENFKNALLEATPQIKDLGRLELEDDEINDVISFLTDSDVTGQRYIAKALNDPQALMKMAWFYLKGEEAINYLAEYYESEISKHSKSSYEKGHKDALEGKTPNKQTRVVINNTNKTTTPAKNTKTNQQQSTVVYGQRHPVVSIDQLD